MCGETQILTSPPSVSQSVRTSDDKTRLVPTPFCFFHAKQGEEAGLVCMSGSGTSNHGVVVMVCDSHLFAFCNCGAPTDQQKRLHERIHLRYSHLIPWFLQKMSVGGGGRVGVFSQRFVHRWQPSLTIRRGKNKNKKLERGKKTELINTLCSPVQGKKQRKGDN